MILFFSSIVPCKKATATAIHFKSFSMRRMLIGCASNIKKHKDASHPVLSSKIGEAGLPVNVAGSTLWTEDSLYTQAFMYVHVGSTRLCL